MKPLNVIVSDTCAGQLAKSKARESVAEAGTTWELALGGRQRRLTGIEAVISVCQVIVSAEDLMTEIAAKFENMPTVDPGRGSNGMPVMVDKRSVVVSQLRNALAVGLEAVDDREGLGSATGHIRRRVQPESRQIEVLHRRILRGVVARVVESGVEHKFRRGRIVGIEIHLRGGGCVPPGLGRRAGDAVSRVELVRLLGDVITREVPGLTDVVIDLDAGQVLVFVVWLHIWVVVVQRAGSGPRWSRNVG